MGPRTYALVLALCFIFLGFRSTVSPPDFDSDEPSHLKTVSDIRKLSGLPRKEHFPQIVYSGAGVDVAYHFLPPTPYLLAAGITAAAGVGSDPADLRPVARVLSLAAGFLTVLVAGLAVRALQPERSGWEGAAVMSAGLTLMPAAQAMFASATSDSAALLAISATVLACAAALRRNWSWRSSMAVAAVSAGLLAVRTTAYPALLFPAAGLLTSRLNLKSKAVRSLAMAGIAFAPNAWWTIRAFSLFGEPFGAETHARYMLDSGFAAQTSEFRLWQAASSGPVKEISLLLGSPWFWVEQSRMLLTARSWIAPSALVIWYALVVVAVVTTVVALTRSTGPREAGLAVLLAASLLAALGAFAVELRISAHYGAFAVGRYGFMNAVPLVIVVTAMAFRSRTILRDLTVSMGLVFAAALTSSYLVTVLR